MSQQIFLYASVFLVSWLNFLPIYTVSLWASSLGYVGSWTKKEEKLLLCISLWLYHPYRHSHHILGNLRKSVFERPRQHAESGLFTFLSSGFANILSYSIARCRQCPDYAHARASSVFSSKGNRTVILTRQDFLPDRTADGDLFLHSQVIF